MERHEECGVHVKPDLMSGESTPLEDESPPVNPRSSTRGPPPVSYTHLTLPTILLV